jgi:hypothetical protein
LLQIAKELEVGLAISVGQEGQRRFGEDLPEGTQPGVITKFEATGARTNAIPISEPRVVDAGPVDIGSIGGSKV